MDDGELLVLLRDLESDRVGRKASISDKSKICQALCAFANDLPNHRQPGVLFVGVNDDESCANLPITDLLLRTLADLRSDGNILPLPAMTVQKRSLEGCDLAIVVVQPSEAPPVRYRGRVWVRVGPRRAVATAEEERRLAERRRGRDLSFELQAVHSATLEDVDLDLFHRTYLPSAVDRDVLESNARAPLDQLASLRFCTPESDAKPTVLGILVLGKDPRQHLPGDYIQFLRIEGTELGDPVRDHKQIGGPLPDLLRLLDETLQVHISISSDPTAQPVEVRQPDYPLGALQQLSRNAVMHRSFEGTNAPVRINWFNDRIEILNPGGPYGEINRTNFGRPGVTDYRNPYLAEAMRNLGYVQKFGYGIPIARRELQRNGNPPPEFVVEETHVLVIVRSRP